MAHNTLHTHAVLAACKMHVHPRHIHAVCVLNGYKKCRTILGKAEMELGGGGMWCSKSRKVPHQTICLGMGGSLLLLIASVSAHQVQPVAALG